MGILNAYFQDFLRGILETDGFTRGCKPTGHYRTPISIPWSQGVQTEALAEEPGASGASGASGAQFGFIGSRWGTNGPTALDVFRLNMFKLKRCSKDDLWNLSELIAQNHQFFLRSI